jgi:hypothetical protein
MRRGCWEFDILSALSVSFVSFVVNGFGFSDPRLSAFISGKRLLFPIPVIFRR